ncbi:MAG: thiol protease/hemagglutinin PrtT [Bacteroidales bacterium]|nr:thiol protease/hemagglutinin PrtT [Bacteroidales bacterium]MBN2749839.1 thiol protease/hemagglutinin PrtT [Bacteroidales bacterium]
MRKNLLTLLFSIIVLLGYSAPIGVEKAQQIAEKFLSQQKGTKTQQQLVLTYTGINRESKGGQATFYVFSGKGNEGFVIAAADNNITPILGYATQGTFDADNMPENLRYWLSFYEENIPLLAAKGKVANVNKGTNSVQPLLRDMAWDQGAPYNDLTPRNAESKATASGCVATAMAQIMRYHRWPVKGSGTVSYTTRTLKKTLTQDLGAKPFDWNNMPGIYSSTSTTAQNAAVAQLMYYAGVSVEMDYDIPANGGSGAYSSDVPNALVKNFNYSIGIELLYRNTYHYTEWAEVIKAELDAKRPVYYAGGSPQGGHAFVCDGYDENGLFHINWGWSGMSNGYFSLLEMNPDAQGIGAGGGGGYINGQQIITGIRPPQAGETNAPAYFVFETLSSSKQKMGKAETTSINITQFWNYSALSSFTGNIGVALYNENGDLTNLLTQDDITKPILPGYGAKEFSFDNIAFTNVANGTYRLHLISKTESSNTWTQIKSLNAITNYITVEVTDTEIIFGSQSTSSALTLEGTIGLPEKVYTNKPVEVSMTLKNDGQTEYSSFVGISVTQESKEEVVIYGKVIIPVGATQTFYFTASSFTETAGEVTVKALYDIYNGANSLDTLSGILTSKQVNILASTTTQGLMPSVISYTIDKNSVAATEEFTVTATLKSNDATNHFDTHLMIFVFKGNNQAGSFGYTPNFSLAPSEEKTLTFRSSLTLAPGVYTLIFAFYNPEDEMFNRFTGAQDIDVTLTEYANPVTDPTEEQAELRVYPNPALDVISVNGLASQGNSLKLFNMQGQITLDERIENNSTINISHLPSGVYIAVITDKNGTISKKVKVVKQ